MQAAFHPYQPLPAYGAVAPDVPQVSEQHPADVVPKQWEAAGSLQGTPSLPGHCGVEARKQQDTDGFQTA